MEQRRAEMLSYLDARRGERAAVRDSRRATTTTAAPESLAASAEDGPQPASSCTVPLSPEDFWPAFSRHAAGECAQPLATCRRARTRGGWLQQLRSAS